MRALTALSATLLVLAACDSKPTNPAATPAPAPAATVTVFAAASTADVLRDAGQLFEAKAGIKVAFSFDSSSSLAKQIKAGAPAEVFISADLKWMDDVAAAGEIRADSRVNLLGNALVLIAPAGRTFEARMEKGFDFAASLPAVRRIAVGDPAHVPAGRYAKQALESLGWWAALEPLLIPALDVRAALRLVELGEADAGIVYSTDARVSDKVTVVGAFPEGSHDAVVYPVALCRNASPHAEAFLQFLRSAEATAMFDKAGFRVLAGP